MRTNTFKENMKNMKRRAMTALLAIVIAFGTIAGGNAFGVKEAYACGVSCSDVGHDWDGGVTASGIRGKLFGTKIYTCKRCGKKVSCTNTEFRLKYQTNTNSFKKTGKTRFTSIVKSTGSLSLKWKKGSDVTGYQIQYSLDSSFKTFKTVQVNNCNSTTRKIAGLKSNQRYYIRIRSYKIVDGEITYSDWSSVTSVKTKAIASYKKSNYNN